MNKSIKLVNIFKPYINIRHFSLALNNKLNTEYKNASHIPVLANEAIEYLNLDSTKTILDMTFGAGGHSKLILDKYPGIKILALDRDPVAHEYAQKLAKEFSPGQITPILGRFSELPQHLKELEIVPNSLDGILFDFGCSSMQFDEADRGFSLSKDGPLDMRMDKERLPNMPTAADVLANIDEQDLYRILKIYGEEKNAKKIARVIVSTRYAYRRIETTRELSELIRSVFNDGEHRQDKLQRHAHIATKTFQALRIFVNNEMNEINYGLTIAPKLLKTDGILVAISFHSLEDTIVKRHITGNVINNSANPLPLRYTSHTLMHDEQLIESLKQSHWKQIHKHVITPSSDEIEQNPRSRSAKLRAAIKIT